MRLLIDTDPGIDDALAIVFALGSPDASVEAITTVAGNTLVSRATANVLRILAVARPGAHPRLAQGAEAPLKRPLVTATHIHGTDGLGHVDRLGDREGRPRYPAATHAFEMLDGP